MTNGIDISKHQGAVDWQSLEAQYYSGKISFVILRAGYGANTIDSQFERNYAQAVQHGIPVGAYWYAYWSKATAEQECAAFLAAVQGKTFQYGIWYDVEYERSITKLSKAQRTANVLTGLSALAASGRYCGLYASTDMINNRLDYTKLKGYDIWCAQYAGKCTCKLPVGIWQYSSKNALGISGYGTSLDCNHAYKDYPSIVTGTLSTGKTSDSPKASDSEPDTGKQTATYTRTVGDATGGDLSLILSKASELGLYVTGKLTIGPMTNGDDLAIQSLCKDLGVDFS